MQSLASLMSFKQSDVGNLEDFYDSDEEAGEERKNNHGSGHSPHVAGKTGAPSLARLVYNLFQTADPNRGMRRCRLCL